MQNLQLALLLQDAFGVGEVAGGNNVTDCRLRQTVPPAPPPLAVGRKGEVRAPSGRTLSRRHEGTAGILKLRLSLPACPELAALVHFICIISSIINSTWQEEKLLSSSSIHE